MKILHYTIGFSPERTGGLVSYATDLMLEQINQGHHVLALYPASQIYFSSQTKVKKVSSRLGIDCFTLLNSLPLPLFGGLSEATSFMVSTDKGAYIDFLSEQAPDVIHLHSFMGLHKEFLEAARKLSIPLVMTTHDYYGLAPIPNFYYNGISFDEDNTNLAWNIMSADALSVKKLRLFQSKYYPFIRSILKKLKRNPKHKSYQPIEEIEESIDFTALRQYYQEMFALVNRFHFNSHLTQSVYKSHLPKIPKESQVLSITTSRIKQENVVRLQRDKKHIAYIGPDEEYKGYFDFLNYVKQIDKNQFGVYTYGHVPNEFAPSFVHQMGRFSQNQLKEVYQNIDILIVPSRWKETFGLVVLEALSFGVEVYASEWIGSKDLLDEAHRFKRVKELTITDNRQSQVNEIKTMPEHVEELIRFYQGIE